MNITPALLLAVISTRRPLPRSLPTPLKNEKEQLDRVAGVVRTETPHVYDMRLLGVLYYIHYTTISTIYEKKNLYYRILLQYY